MAAGNTSHDYDEYATVASGGTRTWALRKALQAFGGDFIMDVHGVTSLGPKRFAMDKVTLHSHALEVVLPGCRVQQGALFEVETVRSGQTMTGTVKCMAMRVDIASQAQQRWPELLLPALAAQLSKSMAGFASKFMPSTIHMEISRCIVLLHAAGITTACTAQDIVLDVSLRDDAMTTTSVRQMNVAVWADAQAPAQDQSSDALRSRSLPRRLKHQIDIALPTAAVQAVCNQVVFRTAAQRQSAAELAAQLGTDAAASVAVNAIANASVQRVQVQVNWAGVRALDFVLQSLRRGRPSDSGGSSVAAAAAGMLALPDNLPVVLALQRRWRLRAWDRDVHALLWPVAIPRLLKMLRTTGACSAKLPAAAPSHASARLIRAVHACARLKTSSTIGLWADGVAWLKAAPTSEDVRAWSALWAHPACHRCARGWERDARLIAGDMLQITGVKPQDLWPQLSMLTTSLCSAVQPDFVLGAWQPEATVALRKAAVAHWRAGRMLSGDMRTVDARQVWRGWTSQRQALPPSWEPAILQARNAVYSAMVTTITAVTQAAGTQAAGVMLGPGTDEPSLAQRGVLAFLGVRLAAQVHSGELSFVPGDSGAEPPGAQATPATAAPSGQPANLSERLDMSHFSEPGLSGEDTSPEQTQEQPVTHLTKHAPGGQDLAPPAVTVRFFDTLVAGAVLRDAAELEISTHAHIVLQHAAPGWDSPLLVHCAVPNTHVNLRAQEGLGVFLDTIVHSATLTASVPQLYKVALLAWQRVPGIVAVIARLLDAATSAWTRVLAAAHRRICAGVEAAAEWSGRMPRVHIADPAAVIHSASNAVHYRLDAQHTWLAASSSSLQGAGDAESPHWSVAAALPKLTCAADFDRQRGAKHAARLMAVTSMRQLCRFLLSRTRVEVSIPAAGMLLSHGQTPALVAGTQDLAFELQQLQHARPALRAELGKYSASVLALPLLLAQASPKLPQVPALALWSAACWAWDQAGQWLSSAQWQVRHVELSAPTEGLHARSQALRVQGLFNTRVPRLRAQAEGLAARLEWPGGELLLEAAAATWRMRQGEGQLALPQAVLRMSADVLQSVPLAVVRQVRVKVTASSEAEPDSASGRLVVQGTTHITQVDAFASPIAIAALWAVLSRIPEPVRRAHHVWPSWLAAHFTGHVDSSQVLWAVWSPVLQRFQPALAARATQAQVAVSASASRAHAMGSASVSAAVYDASASAWLPMLEPVLASFTGSLALDTRERVWLLSLAATLLSQAEVHIDARHVAALVTAAELSMVSSLQALPLAKRDTVLSDMVRVQVHNDTPYTLALRPLAAPRGQQWELAPGEAQAVPLASSVHAHADDLVREMGRVDGYAAAAELALRGTAAPLQGPARLQESSTAPQWDIHAHRMGITRGSQVKTGRHVVWLSPEQVHEDSGLGSPARLPLLQTTAVEDGSALVRLQTCARLHNDSALELTLRCWPIASGATSDSRPSMPTAAAIDLQCPPGQAVAMPSWLSIGEPMHAAVFLCQGPPSPGDTPWLEFDVGVPLHEYQLPSSIRVQTWALTPRVQFISLHVQPALSVLNASLLQGAQLQVRGVPITLACGDLTALPAEPEMLMSVAGEQDSKVIKPPGPDTADWQRSWATDLQSAQTARCTQLHCALHALPQPGMPQLLVMSSPGYVHNQLHVPVTVEQAGQRTKLLLSPGERVGLLPPTGRSKPKFTVQVQGCGAKQTLEPGTRTSQTLPWQNASDTSYPVALLCRASLCSAGSAILLPGELTAHTITIAPRFYVTGTGNFDSLAIAATSESDPGLWQRGGPGERMALQGMATASKSVAIVLKQGPRVFTAELALPSLQGPQDGLQAELEHHHAVAQWTCPIMAANVLAGSISAVWQPGDLDTDLQLHVRWLQAPPAAPCTVPRHTLQLSNCSHLQVHARLLPEVHHGLQLHWSQAPAASYVQHGGQAGVAPGCAMYLPAPYAPSPGKMTLGQCAALVLDAWPRTWVLINTAAPVSSTKVCLPLDARPDLRASAPLGGPVRWSTPYTLSTACGWIAAGPQAAGPVLKGSMPAGTLHVDGGLHVAESVVHVVQCTHDAPLDVAAERCAAPVLLVPAVPASSGQVHYEAQAHVRLAGEPVQGCQWWLVEASNSFVWRWQVKPGTAFTVQGGLPDEPVQAGFTLATALRRTSLLSSPQVGPCITVTDVRESRMTSVHVRMRHAEEGGDIAVHAQPVEPQPQQTLMQPWHQFHTSLRVCGALIAPDVRFIVRGTAGAPGLLCRVQQAVVSGTADMLRAQEAAQSDFQLGLHVHGSIGGLSTDIQYDDSTFRVLDVTARPVSRTTPSASTPSPSSSMPGVQVPSVVDAAVTFGLGALLPTPAAVAGGRACLTIWQASLAISEVRLLLHSLFMERTVSHVVAPMLHAVPAAERRVRRMIAALPPPLRVRAAAMLGFRDVPDPARLAPDARRAARGSRMQDHWDSLAQAVPDLIIQQAQVSVRSVSIAATLHGLDDGAGADQSYTADAAGQSYSALQYARSALALPLALLTPLSRTAAAVLAAASAVSELQLALPPLQIQGFIGRPVLLLPILRAHAKSAVLSQLHRALLGADLIGRPGVALKPVAAAAIQLACAPVSHGVAVHRILYDVTDSVLALPGALASAASRSAAGMAGALSAATAALSFDSAYMFNRAARRAQAEQSTELDQDWLAPPVWPDELTLSIVGDSALAHTQLVSLVSVHAPLSARCVQACLGLAEEHGLMVPSYEQAASTVALQPLQAALSASYANDPSADWPTTPVITTATAAMHARFSLGLRELLGGVYEGVTGIVTQPVQGARTSEGSAAVGALAGLGRGIAGLVTKPVTGALDFLSHTADGLGHGLAAFRPLAQLESLTVQAATMASFRRAAVAGRCDSPTVPGTTLPALAVSRSVSGSTWSLPNSSPQPDASQADDEDVLSAGGGSVASDDDDLAAVSTPMLHTCLSAMVQHLCAVGKRAHASILRQAVTSQVGGTALHAAGLSWMRAVLWRAAQRADAGQAGADYARCGVGLGSEQLQALQAAQFPSLHAALRTSEPELCAWYARSHVLILAVGPSWAAGCAVHQVDERDPQCTLHWQMQFPHGMLSQVVSRRLTNGAAAIQADVIQALGAEHRQLAAACSAMPALACLNAAAVLADQRAGRTSWDDTELLVASPAQARQAAVAAVRAAEAAASAELQGSPVGADDLFPAVVQQVQRASVLHVVWAAMLCKALPDVQALPSTPSGQPGSQPGTIQESSSSQEYAVAMWVGACVHVLVCGLAPPDLESL